MANRTRSKRLFREDRGESLVEFAIAVSVLLMALFGIMDFARCMYTYHFVSYAAQQGARYAMVRGADWTTACASASSYDCSISSSNESPVETYVQDLATPGITGSSITVTPSWPAENVDGSATPCTSPNSANSKGCLVKVVVSYPFKFILPFLPKGSMTMTATSEQIIAY